MSGWDKKNGFGRAMLGGTMLIIVMFSVLGTIAIAVVLALGKYDLGTAAQWLRLCGGTAAIIAAGIAGVWGLRRIFRKETAGQAVETRPSVFREPGRESAPESKPTPEPRPLPENELEIPAWEMKKNAQLGIGDVGPTFDLARAQYIGLFMRERGYEMERALVGGGSSEVRHTGAVAYGAVYGSLDGMMQNMASDYERAEDEASAEYGSWFSALNYHFVRQTFRKGEKMIEAEQTVGLRMRWEPSGDPENQTVAAELIAQMRKDE